MDAPYKTLHQTLGQFELDDIVAHLVCRTIAVAAHLIQFDDVPRDEALTLTETSLHNMVDNIAARLLDAGALDRTVFTLSVQDDIADL